MDTKMMSKYAYKVLWFAAGLVLLDMGLQPFGMGIFNMPLFQTTLSFLVAPIEYIAAFTGAYILIGLARVAMQGGRGAWCGCGTK